MNRLLAVCLAMVCIGLMASCRSQKVAALALSDLSGEWNVVELNGVALDPKETLPCLQFDTKEMRLGGNAGCNRMMGSFEYSEAKAGEIRFPAIATTRMACPDMSREQEMLQALDRVRTFGKVRPSSLAFYDESGKKVLVVEKR